MNISLLKLQEHLETVSSVSQGDIAVPVAEGRSDQSKVTQRRQPLTLQGTEGIFKTTIQETIFSQAARGGNTISFSLVYNSLMKINKHMTLVVANSCYSVSLETIPQKQY